MLNCIYQGILYFEKRKQKRKVYCCMFIHSFVGSAFLLSVWTSVKVCICILQYMFLCYVQVVKHARNPQMPIWCVACNIVQVSNVSLCVCAFVQGSERSSLMHTHPQEPLELKTIALKFNLISTLFFVVVRKGIYITLARRRKKATNNKNDNIARILNSLTSQFIECNLQLLKNRSFTSS